MSFLKKTAKPEIIAVLCVYNEALNIDHCLNHIENYVDQIIILDDGSTDNTLSIAKSHPKVTKTIRVKHKTKWDERKNRERILKKAFQSSKSSNPWALCIDADERFETRFLKDLRKIVEKYSNYNNVFTVHFRELWDDPSHYRSDGVWGEKIKALLFKLQKKMTFNYQQEHHIPWYYQELAGKEYPLDYNLYHLKMIKPKDRQKRADLYNKLDPNKEMQPIGYDYLTDTIGLKLIKITKTHNYDQSTVPDYYKN